MPEAQGGSGGGRIELALICEELGAVSASVAAATVGHIVATLLVVATAGEKEARDLLPRLSSGAQMAALALDGGGTLLDEPAVSVVASGSGTEMILNGVARAVAGATLADVFVVPARGAGDDARLQVFVVETDTAGLTVGAERKMLGLNGSGLANVTFAEVAGATPLSGGDVMAALAVAADNARIGLAAACIGIARAALEASRAHVIASDDGLDKEQSVQWMLADMATETEAGRLLAWYAASRTNASELREAAAMARLLAADAAVGASRRAVQILGAAGNDEETGVERLYRDAKAMEVHHGAAESQRRAVARRLLPDLFDGVG
jgi:alkylation response protein AidB-like acyl-CoA dehydrogenase